MTEQNRSKQEKLEEMIERYREEAMQYRNRGRTLYREEIPAQEVVSVNASPEHFEPQSTMSRKEESDSPLSSSDLRLEEEITDREIPPLQDGVPNDIQGVGDVSDIPEPFLPFINEEENDSDADAVPDSDEGELQIIVSAAIQSIPISLADVLVVRLTERGERIQQYLQTDDSGNTPIIRLPTPAKDLSEQPEPNGVRPYSVYTVTVSHPEYYTVVIRDVQVFSGQRSLLPVNLIPLSEQSFKPFTPNFNLSTEPHPLNASRGIVEE